MLSDERSGRWSLFLASAFLLLFWGISLERTYAYLGLQSRVSAALIERNLHPLSVDFALSYHLGLDWRRQLIGWQHHTATYEINAEGLAIKAGSASLDLRFPFDGAAIDVQKVQALRVNFASSAAAPRGAALVVHANADTPGWIAELPTNLGEDVDLSTLEFAREPQRLERRRWADLPKVGFARLYLELPIGQTVILQQLAWVGAPPTQVMKASVWPPNLLNLYEATRNSSAAWPLVAYPDVWLMQSTLVYFLSTLAALAWLSQLWLWRRPQDAAAIGACTALSFMPVITGLFFDASLGASLTLSVLMGAPIVSLVVCRIRLLRQAGAESGKPRAGVRQAILITSSLAVVAWLGFWGLGQGLTPLLFDAKMAFSYALFAGVQQMLLQGVVLAALERTPMPRALVVVMAASMFALWHLPNLVLMLACFVAALLWCSHFLRFRSFTPLVLSHAVLGWLLSVLFPQAWLRSAKIGVMYFW